MVTTNTNVKDRYAGNGATTSFPTTFKFLDDSHLEVILINDTTGIETTWTLGTQYIVSGAGDLTGTVTVLTSPTDYTPQSGETLFIRSNITATQDTDYIQNDPFPAQSHEVALDKLQLISNEQNEELSRTLKLKKTSQTILQDFPEPEAGKIVQWNSSGDGLENIELPASLQTSDLFSFASIADMEAVKPTTISRAIVDSYHTGLSVGGGPFIFDPTSSETPNGGTVIQTTAGGVGRWLRIDNGLPIDALQFGCRGDGVTVDNTSFQAAATAAGGGVLYVPQTSGGYLITESITFPENTSLIFEKGAYIQATGNATYTQNGLFFFAGSGLGASLGGGLSGALTEGDLSISFNSAPTAVAGDLIIVRNTAAGSWNPVRASYIQGEFCEVKSVSGNTINLVSPLIDSYVITSEVAVVGTTTVNIKNFRMNGNPNDTENLSAIRIEYGRDIDLENIYINEMTSRGVFVLNTFNGTLKNVYTRKSTNDGVGIESAGVSIVSCQSVNTIYSDLNADYHGMSITGGGQIVCRYCYVDYSKIASRVLWAMDLGHGHVEHCGARNKCEINGGFHLGGHNNEVTDCIVREGAQNSNGIAVLSETKSPEHMISGNKFYLYNYTLLNAGNALFDSFTADTILDGTLRFTNNEIYDAREASKTYCLVRNVGSTSIISFDFSGNKQVLSPVGAFVNTFIDMDVTSGSDFGTLFYKNNDFQDANMGSMLKWTDLECENNTFEIPNDNAVGFVFRGKNGTALFVDNYIDGYGGTSAVIAGNSGAPLLSLELRGNTYINGARSAPGTVVSTSFIEVVNSSGNRIGNTDDPNSTIPVSFNAGSATFGVNINGDIYLGGPPDIAVNALGICEFTFEKKIDLTTPATAFNIWSLSNNVRYMPTASIARADTDVTATNGDYYSIGVDAANRRVDYGVSAVAAATNKHSKNSSLQKILAPSDAAQDSVGTEIIKLMSVNANTDGAILSNNIGGAGESITVQLKGIVLGKLRTLA